MWNKKAKNERNAIKNELANLKVKRNAFEEDLRSLQQDLKSFQNYHQELSPTRFKIPPTTTTRITSGRK